MERISKLQEIEVTLKDSQWEQKSCYKNASYTCAKHKYVLLWQNCMNSKHFKCKTMSYYNLKDLSSIVLEIATMLERIILNWNKLEDSDEIDFVREEVKKYEGNVAEFEKMVIKAIESDKKAYRKTSITLYNEILEFKKKLFESKMYDTFKELFAVHQLTQIPNASDEQTTSNSGWKYTSDSKLLLDQIQQFIGRKKISSQTSVTMDDITDQVKSLEDDAGSINIQIIQIAQLLLSLLQNETSSSQSHSIFSTDMTVAQALQSLAKSSRSQYANLSLVLK